MNPTPAPDSLVAVIAPLARQIAAIRQRMHAIGMFTNDRERLDCPHCGLREDVLMSGLLINYREPSFHQDTGLRFEELTPGTFRCPSCGQKVRDPFAKQTRIVAEVERRLSVVGELESVVSANLQRATRFCQPILQKAFTGELL